MLQQSQIEQKMLTEQNLIFDQLPILLPKNTYTHSLKEIEQYQQKNALIIDSANSPTMNYQYLSMKNLFQNHYSHIIFYCMIQFRNYQAVNFNILYLAISNFISQRQMDPTFLRHFKENLRNLVLNYLKLKKTSEYEIFLGGSQRLNHMVASPTIGSSLESMIRMKFRYLSGQQKTFGDMLNEWKENEKEPELRESNQCISVAAQYVILLAKNQSQIFEYYQKAENMTFTPILEPQTTELEFIDEAVDQHVKQMTSRKQHQTTEKNFEMIKVSIMLNFMQLLNEGSHARAFTLLCEM